jgi:hypothetical protein
MGHISRIKHNEEDGMTGARTRRISASDVRAAMFGTPVEGVMVVRQAWRTTEDDSDELALISAQESWWIARRISDRLTIWACAGDVEAEATFDTLLAAARDGEPAWNEATERLLAS